VKVKRDHVVFSLVFKAGPFTAKSIERAYWRELSIDIAVCGPTLSTSENNFILTFTFTYLNSLIELLRDEVSFKVSSIRTPMLIQWRLERTETNIMHFKWDVT